MYLNQLLLENSGPLKKLSLELPFNGDGTPKPLVLVGENGSGKTSLQSIVVDALFEAAAKFFLDVVPGMTTISHDWFRVLGNATTSMGAANSFAVLRFDHHGKEIWYHAKSGKLNSDTVKKALPPAMQGYGDWPEDGSAKDIDIDGEEARKLFQNEALVYFPANRFEQPGWLNVEVVPAAFDTASRFAKRMAKPIYVDQPLRPFAQWLMGVITDARVDVSKVVASLGNKDSLTQIVQNANIAGQALNSANEVLSVILDAPNARFVWVGRKVSNKLAIAVGNNVTIPTLAGLSMGQATLLGIFGTLLRYGDPVGPQPFDPRMISGICVIDEIDSHLHVDLQQRALPKLIRMFPRVQFIVSAHSPLFMLAMQKEFGSEGMTLCDLPSGQFIGAERYSEFAAAFETMKATKSFDDALKSEAASAAKGMVFVEGETDPQYLELAAHMLGRADLLNRVQINWIGAKDPSNGNAFHTGKDALNHTAKFFRANPDIVQRHILLLYDNDAAKPAIDEGRLHVRSMPTNAENKVVQAGIENLLPGSLITGDLFSTSEQKSPNGKTITISELKKTALCAKVCEERKEPSDFVHFAVALDLIEAALAGTSG